MGKSRKAPIAQARFLVWFVARQQGMTLQQIARAFDRDHTTILHGIRSPDDPDSRYSEMPRFGADGILDAAQIDQVTNYVLALAKLPHDTAKAEAGATVYADNCVACHMEDGTGDRSQGAPNLTDAVWLYNVNGQADEATIRAKMAELRAEARRQVAEES